MRKGDLLRKISELPDDVEIVVQKNHPAGGFQLFDFTLWPGGHIGYRGPIIQLTEEIHDSIEAVAKYQKGKNET